MAKCQYDENVLVTKRCEVRNPTSRKTLSGELGISSGAFDFFKIIIWKPIFIKFSQVGVLV